jgi:hypothetical protein
MVLYPEAAKKAQAELDAVIGKKRLPMLGDRPDLPYVTAFWMVRFSDTAYCQHNSIGLQEVYAVCCCCAARWVTDSANKFV